MSQSWKKCSACKKEILLKSRYYQCSVSTCNGLRTGLVFCSVPCFERHLPGARHKDAAAIESFAPATPSPEPGPVKRIIPAQTNSTAATLSSSAVTEGEILVVVSKLKKYILDRSGMNTSQSVMDVLSSRLRKLCDQAIQEAQKDGRKTVMDRDFK
jgi:hypothetical protein